MRVEKSLDDPVGRLEGVRCDVRVPRISAPKGGTEVDLWSVPVRKNVDEKR